MATLQQPLNPYIAGRAIGSERGFFGRQDILREVERTLTSPDQNALVLFGQRRIGKTSILLQLERRLPSPPFVPVYFDLMDKARLPLNRVLYELAATVAPLVDVPPPGKVEFEGSDDAFRRVFLPTAYEALAKERRLVFLFDEFDVLGVAAEEKLPDTAAAQAFFPYLRGLMAKEPRLGFVFVVGRKTDELSTDFLATFKAARYRRVSVLKSEAAQELITLAQREGSLNFTDEAVERILALTAGHPYFTQLFCQILFDWAYDAEPEGVPTVDATDVEAATPDVLEAGNQAFEWVWDGLPPAERIIFSAIATHADEATVLTGDGIMAILQDAGIRILIKELALAPRTLVEWEMLKEAESGYRFFVELMRHWVAKQKRLEQVKDERDRLIPLADMLYQSGAGFYRAGEIESAIGQLQQALRINPNHLKARLLLGTIYREQDQLEEALAESETAYRYDEVEGRYELVRTLLAHGEALERGDDEDEALKVYERVLEVSPREQVAQERWVAIWVHRGDAALEANDFETAIAAYEQAKAKEKLEQAKRKLTWFFVQKISGGYEDFIPEQFADRESERLLIQHRVEAAQTGEIEYPLIEFYGVVGQGKSWLLSYIAHQYWFSKSRGPSREKPTFSVKIDFGIFRTLSHSYPLLESFTTQIRVQLAEAEPNLTFSGSLTTDASPSENVDIVAKELAEFVIRLTDRYVPVLVFDATERADEQLLDWLEEQVVYPIIRTNRAAFVFSGRLWHRWKIFEVRRRVEPVQLSPLDRKRGWIEGTAELLTKLDVEQAEGIAHALYSYAFGHPLASKVIFKELQKQAPKGIDEHIFERTQDVIAEIVKDKVVEERFFDELGAHDYLEPLLWGVCILRKFNPTPLRHFTVSFIGTEHEQKPGGFYLDAIRDMQETTLVQWSSAAGGYILDPVVRKIMANNLSMRNPAEFHRRHQEAVRLYENWIEQFPRNAVGFLIERTFHRARTLQDSKTRREIADTLVSEFDQILKDVEKHPDVQWDLPDMAAALNEELGKDEELMEVISEDGFEKLMERAERFREEFRGPWS